MTSNQRRPTRILVVDDHPILRLGIQQMLAAEKDLEVCAEAESADAARQLALSARPDLAIVDLSLAHGTGLDVIRWLRDAVQQLPVLVLSMHDETLFAERVLRAGARGYIMKREAITELIGAIRQILAGRVYVSDAMAQAMLERLGIDGNGSANQNPLRALSDRELEVFDLLGGGLSTSAIAEQLGVSIKTVETYRAHIKTKLNLKDAVDLIRVAATWRERV